MFDLIFYPSNNEEPEYIEISAEMYEWLARSEFSKIGQSVTRTIHIDGEEEKVPVVQLNQENRQRLRNFFIEPIIQESDAVFKKLGDIPEKQEYLETTYRLRKLLQLRQCIENENYYYLQRVQ